MACLLVPVALELILADPVSLVGACEEFMLMCYNGSNSNCSAPTSAINYPITETDAYSSVKAGITPGTIGASYNRTQSTLDYMGRC